MGHPASFTLESAAVTTLRGRLSCTHIFGAAEGLKLLRVHADRYCQEYVTLHGSAILHFLKVFFVVLDGYRNLFGPNAVDSALTQLGLI